MGFSSASGSVEQKSWFDRYVEDKDNIKDIKDDLSKLKKNIQNTETSVTKDEKVDYSNKENVETTQTREQFADGMDAHIESIFDAYITDPNNQSRIKAMILEGDSGIRKLQEEFNQKIWGNAINSFSTDYNVLITNNIQPFTFELNGLKEDIKQELTQTKGGNAWRGDGYNNGVNESNTTASEHIETGYHADKDYVERFDSRYYGGDISYERYNIYRDSKTKKILEELFDDETIKEIKKGMFNINLSKEDGLAGIIISLRDIMPSLKDYNPDTATPEEKAKLGAYRNIVKYDNGVWRIRPDQQIIKENLNILIDNGSLSYTKKSGLLSTEINKIAKILSRSSRETLDTFAALAQSKDDMDMVLRERYNAGAMTGTLRDDKDKKTYKKNNEGAERQDSVITPENVLYFLCDYNSDLTLSAEYEKRNNLKQQDQGDVGSIFGQQLMFTFEQAIALQNLEHPGEGEQRVIHNILKNIQISDRRLPSAQREKFIQNMIDDKTKCTKENLTKLINGYYDKEKKFVEGMPEFKIFFLDSIKKINGGAETITPDLYDTLIGEDADNLMDMYKNNTEELNNRLEQILVQSQDPAIKTLIEQQGIVRVRNTLVGKIIEYMNNVTITLNDGTLTNLAAAGIGKDREIDKARNEVLETVMSYISTGLHYNKKEGYRLTIGTGKSGISKSERTKRNRGAEAGVITGKTFDLYLGLDGEILEQTNHRKVINANLSDVRKAQYVGLEGGAGASFKGIELFGGVTREQDPAMGINQIDEQYEEVSRKIFDISSINADILSSKEALSNYLQQKITSEKYGPYQAFIDTNTQHLEDNLSFIIRYMDARGFFGTDGKIAQLPITQRKEAVRELITLLQSGNREERRHNVIAGLHGHIELTKLSFGVTTSKLTFSNGSRGVGAESNSGHTVEGLDGEAQAGMGGDEITGVDRFGIANFYVGMRLSTWKNKYVPRAQQYLYTQYEIGQGVDTHSLEHKKDLTEDINYQAEYLKAVFNAPKLDFSIENGKIIIKLNDATMSIAKYLNIHTTDEAMENFSLSEKKLVIGSVGPIGAYTVTSGNGVRRILSLGTEKVDEAKRIPVKKAIVNDVKDIEAKITRYEDLSQEKISTIIDNMGNDEAETDSKRFFDEEGKLITPSGEKVDYVGCKSGDTLKHGTLTITKKIDGRYSVKYTSSSVEKLTITYIDMKEYQVRLDDPDSRILEKSLSTDNLFTPEAGSEIANAQKYLDTLTRDIYNIEHTNPEQEVLYGKFMTSASAIIDGSSTIDDKELNDAIGYLKELLPDTSNVDQLKVYLSSSNRYTKSYVVDRLKQIFAKEDWYTEGKLLSNIIFNGRTGRKTITGPSGDELPSELRSEFESQKQTWKNERYKANPTIHKNLIGYTAFYRTYGGIQQTKNYSITSLGTTSSQVDLHTVAPQQKETIKNWFMNNFKNNEKEVEYFATQIEKKCQKEGISVSLKTDSYEETRKNIESILGHGILLDSGKKISIDVDYVFYLLGECCNESIGMNIKGINIEKPKEDQDDGNNTDEGRYSATGESEKIYEYGVDVKAKNHSVPMQVIPQEKKVSVKGYKDSGLFDPSAIDNSGHVVY